MLRFFVFFFVLIIFSCCNKELHSDFFKSIVPVLPKEAQSNYTFKLLDSLKLVNTDTICFRPSIKSFYKDSLLYYLCDNKIIKYNVKKEEISEVNLPLKFNGFVVAIDVIGLDSLYVLQSMPTKLFFIDINAGKYKVTELPKINFETDNNFFNARAAVLDYSSVNYNLDFNNLKFDKFGNQMHIGVTPYDADVLDGFEKTNRIGVYDIKLNRWVKIYASPKGVYSFRGSFTFGKNTLSSKNILFKGDSTFVAYPVNHTIQLYIKKQFFKNINFTSKHSKSIQMPLELEEANKIETNKKLLSSTAYYKGVFYHEKVAVYSRIYFNEQESFNNKGLYNGTSKRDRYVVFKDKNFNYVGEFKLPNTYNFVLNTADGFYIFKDNYKTKLEYKIIKK